LPGNTFARKTNVNPRGLTPFKELEAEHFKLKRMYADLAMENDALRELIEKKL
jgi:hypothetical protein